MSFLRPEVLFRVFALVACGVFASLSQRTRSVAQERGSVEVQTPVPLPTLGTPRQLWAFAAPDDPDRLLVCTFESDGAHGRSLSVGYVSFDSGNTWMRTLVASSSLWVAETSCAAGRDGRAYFSASASDTSHGGQAHSLGTMEVYRSLDGGLTWAEPRRYPFIDWTSLAVVPGSDREEGVYLFGNLMAAGFGDAGEGKWSSQRGLMAVSKDGLHFASPLYPSETAQPELAIGAFPVSNLLDEKGHVLVLVARRSKGEYDFSPALYVADGKSYEPAGRIELPRGMSDPQTLSGQMAIDRSQRFHGRLYVVFPATQDERSVVAFARSEDDGRTWHTRALMQDEGKKPSERRSTFAGVAVNDDGVVAVEWLAPGRCPVLGISRDGGETVSETISLGGCRHGVDRELTAGAVNDLLWTLTSYRFRGKSEKKGPGFTTFVETASQWDSKITTDSAGRFHVFWEELSDDGRPELMTSSVIVKDRGSNPAAKFDTSGWLDISDSAVTEVGHQDFDPYTAVFRLDVSVNSPWRKAPQPAFLEVIGDHSDCGTPQYLNAFARSPDGHAIFRIPQRKGAGDLVPGDTSLPVHLEVKIPGCENVSGELVKESRVHVKPGKGGYELSPLAVWFRVLAGTR